MRFLVFRTLQFFSVVQTLAIPKRGAQTKKVSPAFLVFVTVYMALFPFPHTLLFFFNFRFFYSGIFSVLFNIFYTSACKCYITVFHFFRSIHNSNLCPHSILLLLRSCSCALAFLRKFVHAQSQKFPGAYFPAAMLVPNMKRINGYSHSYLLHFRKQML